VIGVSFFEGKNDACYMKNASCTNPPVEALLDWASREAPSKELMIPESTPQDINQRGGVGGSWVVGFLQHVQRYISLYDIRYWTYINQNWPAHGWGEGWGDSRVQASPEAMEFWRETVLGKSSRYLCLSGVPCTTSGIIPTPNPPPSSPTPVPAPPSACKAKCAPGHCAGQYPICCADTSDCYTSVEQAKSAKCQTICA